MNLIQTQNAPVLPSQNCLLWHASGFDREPHKCLDRHTNNCIYVPQLQNPAVDQNWSSSDYQATERLPKTNLCNKNENLVQNY